MEILKIKGRDELIDFQVVKAPLNGALLRITGLMTYYCEIGRDYSIAQYEINAKLEKFNVEFNSFSSFIYSLGM